MNEKSSFWVKAFRSIDFGVMYLTPLLVWLVLKWLVGGSSFIAVACSCGHPFNGHNLVLKMNKLMMSVAFAETTPHKPNDDTVGK